MRDRRLLRMTANGIAPFADLSALAPGFTNDMVMDQDGRAYVGNFGFDLNGGESPKPTVLICVEPDGAIRVVADDLWFPNGAVITPDNRTLLIAETFAGRITAFDIQPGGDLSNRRIFAYSIFETRRSTNFTSKSALRFQRTVSTLCWNSAVGVARFSGKFKVLERKSHTATSKRRWGIHSFRTCWTCGAVNLLTA